MLTAFFFSLFYQGLKGFYGFSLKNEILYILSILDKNPIYDKNPRRTPAATAEPITPATFGPIAWSKRKLCGLALKPS